MTDRQTQKNEPPKQREQSMPKPRFLDGHDARSATLGKIRTEEEARLAAEIEKLR
jgi:hypothetical protein